MRETDRTITYLVPFAPSRRDAVSWGFEVMRGRGFDVQVIDVGPLLRARFAPPIDGTAESAGWAVKQAATVRELGREVAERSAGFFVDFIVGLNEVGAREAPLSRVFSQGGARLIVVQGGLVPPARSRSLPRAEIARRVLDPARWANLLSKPRARRMRRQGLGYPLPVRVFVPASAALDDFVSRYPSVADRIVHINSYDYDRFIEAGVLPERDGSVLFIDEGVAGHPDFGYLRIGTVKPGPYLGTMRRLFDRIEAETGLTVRIAAHPKVDYTAMPDAYGDREILAGQTLQLTARADGIVTHASTAVAFATVLERPILLAVTRGMAETGYTERVLGMADALGVPVLDADDDRALASFDAHPSGWPVAHFEEYRDTWVRDPLAPRRGTWEIVADELDSMVMSGAV